jgi:hypothetical protein
MVPINANVSLHPSNVAGLGSKGISNRVSIYFKEIYMLEKVS